MAQLNPGPFFECRSNQGDCCVTVECTMQLPRIQIGSEQSRTKSGANRHSTVYLTKWQWPIARNLDGAKVVAVEKEGAMAQAGRCMVQQQAGTRFLKRNRILVSGDGLKKGQRTEIGSGSTRGGDACQPGICVKIEEGGRKKERGERRRGDELQACRCRQRGPCGEGNRSAIGS